MTHAPATHRSTKATRLTIPEEQIISVEHPCIVKNVEKAIDMIGGPPGIAQVIETGSDKTFSLSFRPQDPTSKTIIANKRIANNVLLRISVPRRTGRKRKRGSNDPWTEDRTSSIPLKDANYLVNSMADNVESYKVTAISSIPSTHIWRSLPDFVYSTANVPIVQDAKNKLLSQHYPTIKTFELPRTYGIEDTTTLPPPIWSNQQIPGNYTYRQNPSVKVSHDPVTGKSVMGNTQAPPKTYTHQIAWDDKEYPTAVMLGITPLEKQTPINQETVAALRELFDERPIWSRRALLNCMPSHLSAFNVVRFCIGYVSYAIRSGPWRDTLVKLGVDPRTDPKYRIYQTIMLQLVPRGNQLALAAGSTPRKTTGYKPKQNPSTDVANGANGAPSTQAERERLLESRKIFQRKWTGSDNATSHIFDGETPLPPDGKVWQLCDFTDPQLVKLRDISDLHIRLQCEDRYFGWYENGTNAKIRVALKAKVEALAEGHPLDPQLLEGFLQLPEKLAFEVDLEAASNALITYPMASNDPSDTQTPTNATGATSSSLSAYLGDNPTNQQLSWAAAYRAFAKTGLGSVPASGASGKGRLSKSKPKVRKGFLDRQGAQTELAQALEMTREPESPNGATQDAPIDVDLPMVNEMDHDVDADEGPQVDDGEEIYPSIEVHGFDVDDDDGSELGLEHDEPLIKLEEEIDQSFVHSQAGQTSALFSSKFTGDAPIEPIEGQE